MMKRISAITLLPTHLFLLTLFIGVVASVLLPRLVLNELLVSICVALGALFMGMALLIAILVQRQFKSAGMNYAPNIVPKQLLRSSLFALSRNPLYLALVLLMAALGLLFCTVYLLGSSVLLFYALDRYIKAVEEPLLHATFHEAFQRYCQQTPRWLAC